MYFRIKQPPHLKKPILKQILYLSLYALAIPAVFILTEKILPTSGQWRPFIAAIPGLGMCSILYIIYVYHLCMDDLEQQIGTNALAVSAISGLVTMCVSISRAAIGGYAEFNTGVILIVMSITFLLISIILSWRYR